MDYKNSKKNREAMLGKRVELVLLLLSFLFSVSLRSQQSKADRGFELYRFSDVIPLYKEAYEKSNLQKRSMIAYRLGECYRMINEPDSAVLWYKESTLNEGFDPLSYFYLGESLRTQERYTEAHEAYIRYDSLVPDDPRGSLFASYCRLVIDDWSSLPERYWIRSLNSINTAYSEFSPLRYGDGILFASDRFSDSIIQRTYQWTGRNYLNIFYSKVQDFDSTWLTMGAPIPADGLGNQVYHDVPSFIAGDSILYVTRAERERVPTDLRKIRTYQLKIYHRSLHFAGDTSYIPFTYNSDDYSVAHPVLASQGDRIYFSSDMDGGYGGMDLYYCDKDDDGNWDFPVNLGGMVNSRGNEVFPQMLNDTTLYYSSDYLEGYGGLDIFRTRLRYDTLWEKPENLKRPINSSRDDFSLLFLDESVSSGLLSSSRVGGMGSDDLYSFTLRDYYLEGYVKDRRTLEPLAGSHVFLLDSISLEVRVVETDSKGKYRIAVRSGTPYIAKAARPNYIDDCYSFRFIPEDTSFTIEAPRDLLLDKLEVNKVVVMENIYYDFDKWAIREDARTDLDWLAGIMKQNDIRVELGAHTDSRGSNRYNEKLSQRRAESAVNYLVSMGIDASRLEAKGYGELELVNRCSNGISCTPAEHQANRRTEFKIIGYLKPEEASGVDLSEYTARPVISMDALPDDFFSSCLGRQGIETSRTRVVSSESITDRQVGYYETPPTGGCYGVKILTNKALIDLEDPLWNGLTKKNWYYDGEIYHYLVGCTRQKGDADRAVRRMQSLGYNEATIVRLTPEGLKEVE
jgi:peptidoglycan-associated lipoprotein